MKLINKALMLYFILLPIYILGQPAIDIWYGHNQIFGDIGTPQNQINILGNVDTSNGFISLSYILNNSASRSLNVGPYPSTSVRRLYNPGDFNIEIFTNTLNGYSKDASLLEGSNKVIITASDAGGSSIDTVNFEFTSSNTWPSTYSVDWDTVTNIQNVAQVVDGKWYLDGSGADAGVRIVNNEWGYDRLLAVGDYTWENYEIELRFKLNGVYEKTAFPSNGAAFAMILRWLGQTDNPVAGQDPKAGFYPYGAFVDYVPKKEWNPSLFNLFEVSGNEGDLIDSIQTLNLTLGTWYNIRARIQSNPGSSPVINAKIWEDGSSEPGAWQLSGTHPLGTTTPASGCILFIAHHVDATFGNFTITPLSPLPVELISFTCSQKGNAVNLKWTTSTELNNLRFDIERSSDNTIWKKIGEVAGAGNSNSENSYSFADSKPEPLNYYRLKQIDIDGSNKYSESVEVVFKSDNFILEQNYPNPFNPTTRISYFVPKKADVRVEIISELGQIINEINLTSVPAGWNNVNWSGENFASGMYLYRVKIKYLDNSESIQQIRKMLLLK